ncbi:hypothetical protein J6590_036063 [Homalodisca vitripennis]|nr:hypothetical protein J6590_036063 [Homalodisca vitripennis]
MFNSCALNFDTVSPSLSLPHPSSLSLALPLPPSPYLPPPYPLTTIKICNANICVKLRDPLFQPMFGNSRLSFHHFQLSPPLSSTSREFGCEEARPLEYHRVTNLNPLTSTSVPNQCCTDLNLSSFNIITGIGKCFGTSTHQPNSTEILYHLQRDPVSCSQYRVNIKTTVCLLPVRQRNVCPRADASSSIDVAAASARYTSPRYRVHIKLASADPTRITKLVNFSQQSQVNNLSSAIVTVRFGRDGMVKHYQFSGALKTHKEVDVEDILVSSARHKAHATGGVSCFWRRRPVHSSWFSRYIQLGPFMLAVGDYIGLSQVNTVFIWFALLLSTDSKR